MLLYRIMSALVGIPVILYAFWLGGRFLSGVVLIIAILGVREMCRLWGKAGVSVWMPGALLGTGLFVVSAHSENEFFLGAALFCTLAAGLVYMVTVYPKFSFTDLSSTVFTSIYAGWLLTHLISLRQLPGGFHFILLVLATTWSTDTFAYFVGINLGRHKLAPKLSPGKSVEGAVGGLTGSILAAVILGLLNARMPLGHYVAVGLIAGILGQAGDLVESAFKRMAGVKDSGTLIPGHGGILDRFDSLIVTAPVVYYYLKLFIMN